VLVLLLLDARVGCDSSSLPIVNGVVVDSIITSSISLSPLLTNDGVADVDATVDVDTPTAGVDAAGVDAAGVDAAGVDAAGVDAAGVDAAGVDAFPFFALDFLALPDKISEILALLFFCFFR